ncbi:MAG: cutinase family protein [Mycobacteriaceae bacterium]
MRLLLRFLTVATSILGAVFLWSLATASTASAATPVCPGVQVIAIPGTWETHQGADPQHAVGLLKQVTDPLIKSLPGRVQIWYAPYVATALPGESALYADSKTQAVSVASAEIAHTAATCSHTQFALVGYSQGADAAGDLAAQIGNDHGPVPAARLLAVGLVSDPGRTTVGEPLIGPPAVGVGFAGDLRGGFGAVASRVVTLCAPTDLYCATPPTATATAIAGQVMSSLSTSPVYLVGRLIKSSRLPETALHTLQQMSVHGLTPLIDELRHVISPDSITQLATALRGLAPDAILAQVNSYQAFIASGVHSSYGTYIIDGQGNTATQWLCQWFHDHLAAAAVG